MQTIFLYILLFLSIFMETGKTIFSNSFSKNILKNDTDIYKFNFFTYLGSIVVLMFYRGGGISIFSVILSFFFSIAIWLNQYFMLKALEFGSMTFTTFIAGSSLIIPVAFSAIVWNEKITLIQIVMLAILIVSMALALDIKRGNETFKWLVFAFLTMASTGVIGIIQSIHQSSDHAGELASFLRYSFIFSALINLIGWKWRERKENTSFSIKGKTIIQAGLTGIFIGAVHIINLYLAGVLPKVILFPAVNGGLIFVTLIADLIFFKERLNWKQWIGIIIGSVALCIMGI